MVAAAVHRGVIVACVVALCGCEYPREPGWGYRGGADAAALDVRADSVGDDSLVAVDLLVVDVAPDHEEGDAGSTADVPPVDVPLVDVPLVDVPLVDVPLVDVPSSTITQRSCVGATASAGCGMVVIPRSTSFVMGAPRQCGGTPDADCAYFGLPTRSIAVDPFAIDAYEVTVARFRVFWTMTGGSPSLPVSIRYRGGDLLIGGSINTDAELRTYSGSPTASMLCNWQAGREDHPMNCVNWTTAQAFCAWDTLGGRLPTQAEWEFAARGNGSLVCPWGPCSDASAIGTRVCWSGAGVVQQSTCRVVEPSRSGGDSPFGVHDMAGNVWEWTADWYAATTVWWTSIASPNPICGDSCPDRAGDRVIRGGSLSNYGVANLRSASRNFYAPMEHLNNVGFRCARDMP